MEEKILVVDDEPVVVELLKANFTEMGFQVIKASNGLEALEALKKDKPDVIITDLIMPYMDGIELIKKIKENPETTLVPIIVITAMAERETLLKAVELGVDEFITKPFDRMILSARIKSIFKAKRLQVELLEHEVECERSKLLSEIILTIFHYVRNTMQPLAIADSRFSKSPSEENIALLFQTSTECVKKIDAIMNTLHEYEEKDLIKMKTYTEGINMLDLEREIQEKLKIYANY